jgi:hypothetical protein
MDRQKARVASMKPPDIGPSGRKDLVFDARELLHWNHIYDGQVGAWKHCLLKSSKRI